jgi:hypothetical protein
MPTELTKQPLDLITEKALAALEEFDAHGRKSIELSVNLGGYIAMAKGVQHHGQFANYCREVLRLGPSQSALHRRLYEVRADINAAREWAKSSGIPHHDSESPERVLKLVGTWKKREAAQGSSGNQLATAGAKDYADKVRAILQADESAKAMRKTMPSGIVTIIEKEAAAVFAHQCSTGVDLLSRSQEYLALLLNRLADQTCGTPQVSTVLEETLSVDQLDDGMSQEVRPEPAPEIEVLSRGPHPKGALHGTDLLPNKNASTLMRVSERR